MKSAKCFLSFFFAAGISLSSQGANLQANKADDFVDSIGVCTHVSYADTPYSLQYNEWKALLLDLGVRHIRDGVPTNAGKEDKWWPRMRDLGNSGIGITLNIGMKARDADSNYEIDTNINERLGIIENELLNACEMIEGVNEPDNAWKDRFAAAWTDKVRYTQEKLYTEVKRSVTLNQFPVVAPPLAHYWHNSVDLGDLSASVDFGNMHPYPGGEEPEKSSGMHAIMDRISEYCFSGRPFIATETGYHNALNDSGGQPAVPEDIEGIYASRLFLEYYRAGVVRTFFYEFIDLRPDSDLNDNQANFGLLENDLSPKPAYTSLKNMITILDDSSTSFSPVSLDCDISGNLTDVRTMLFQKSNGKYYLAVWKAAKIWDEENQQEIEVPDDSLVLTLNKVNLNSAKVFLPINSASGSSMNVQNARTIELAAGPEVRIYELDVTASNTDFVTIEAEDAVLTPPFQIFTDTTASQGEFCEVPNGRGNETGAQLNFSFRLNSGTWHIWCLVKTPAGSDNSFFMNVDGSGFNTWQTAPDPNWRWVEYGSGFSLSSGIRSLVIKQREDGSKIDKIILTTDSSYDPNDGENIAKEAENAGVLSPMVIQSDSSAQNGLYVIQPNGSSGTGYLHTVFDIQKQGNYIVWCRLNTPTKRDDSFYVSINGESESAWHTGVHNWEWVKLLGNDNGWSMSPGVNRITFRKREDGAAIDAIILTTDPSFTPN